MNTKKNSFGSDEKIVYETPLLEELVLTSNNWTLVQGGSVDHELEEEGEELG